MAAAVPVAALTSPEQRRGSGVAVVSAAGTRKARAIGARAAYDLDRAGRADPRRDLVRVLPFLTRGDGGSFCESVNCLTDPGPEMNLTLEWSIIPVPSFIFKTARRNLTGSAELNLRVWHGLCLEFGVPRSADCRRPVANRMEYASLKVGSEDELAFGYRGPGPSPCAYRR